MGIKRLIGTAFGDSFSNPKLVLRRGVDYIKQGDTKHALRCFDRVLDRYTRCADAYYWKGWTLHRLGLEEEAISNFSKAIEIEPQSKIYLFHKGNSLACLARFEEAIVCYAMALELDPEFSEAYSNISVCYRRIGEYKKAMECVCEAEKAKRTSLTRLRGAG